MQSFNIVCGLLHFTDEEVCFDIKISTVHHGSDSEWQLGICDGKGTTYQNFREYLQRCCIKPGKHTLTCTNRRNPYGWDEGYIEIQGHRYCNDFMSYRLMQKIIITGMKKICKYIMDMIRRSILLADTLNLI